MSEPKEMKEADEVGDTKSAQTSEVRERTLATILNNSLVASNQLVAERIQQNAIPLSFKKGEKLIVQGASDDCVYFIMSGKVEVKINSQHIDTRSAPQVVGEMAAKRAGAERTADVIAASNLVEVLTITGGEFRALMRDFDGFRKNLDDEIDELSRKKISQLGERKKARGLSWTIISGVVGGVCCFAIALATFLVDFATIDVVASSVSGGLLTFVAMLLLNPELRYRNLAGAAGYALIGLVVYGSVSFALTIKGENADLPLIDFSVQTEQKLGMFLIGSIALLILTFLGGILDLRLGRSSEN